MQEQIIVIQTGNATSGGIQISYFDTPEAAAGHIEGCLAAGHPRDSINIYRATRLAMQITQRPVVSLADSVPAPIPAQYAAEVPQAPTSETHIPEFARHDLTPRDVPPPTLPDPEPRTEDEGEAVGTQGKKTTFWRKTK